MRIAVVVVAGCLASLSCGGGGGTGRGGGAGGGGTGGTAAKGLDCAWLASDNCWRTMMVAAQACAAPANESGTLNAEQSTCTYESGPVVTFATPVTDPLPDPWLWQFMVARSGQTCLRYTEMADQAFDLQVGSQTFKQRIPNAAGLSFTCPDGTTYATDDALSLLKCPNGLTSIPGTTNAATSTDVNFSFLGGASVVHVFDCPR
jgi:hypothetical protein